MEGEIGVLQKCCVECEAWMKKNKNGKNDKGTEGVLLAVRTQDYSLKECEKIAPSRAK
jgi:hypothetical protein